MGKGDNLPSPGETGAAATDQAREFEGKGACEFKQTRFSDQIMPHILNLVKQIKSAFYSLSKSKIVEYHVQENDIAPGKKEILIDNKQHYKIMGKDIDMISYQTLCREWEDCPTRRLVIITTNSPSLSLYPLWDKKPLRNRDTVSFPLVGRFMEMGRRGMMLATHAMMGFGKDPDSH
ncbi:hypothetical protein Bca52824_094899 [Brassica carinata]|uniref:Uncharacterized protein n=1 Tax=Brassica carinata TaxID=52824 RepID=A0A8X7P353_BRACI|nr:hypothetical protein Bca52824_094899 [Brassica carinata]